MLSLTKGSKILKCLFPASPGFRSSDPTQSENRGHPEALLCSRSRPQQEEPEAAGLVPPQRCLHLWSLPPTFSILGTARPAQSLHGLQSPDKSICSNSSLSTDSFQPARQPLNNNNKSKTEAAAVQCYSSDWLYQISDRYINQSD